VGCAWGIPGQPGEVERVVRAAGNSLLLPSPALSSAKSAKLELQKASASRCSLRAEQGKGHRGGTRGPAPAVQQGLSAGPGARGGAGGLRDGAPVASGPARC